MNLHKFEISVLGSCFRGCVRPKGLVKALPKMLNSVDCKLVLTISTCKFHAETLSRLDILFYFFSAGSQNMDLGTKLTAMDATDAKTPAIEASRRPESNGRRPGPRSGQNPRKKK